MPQTLLQAAKKVIAAYRYADIDDEGLDSALCALEESVKRERHLRNCDKYRTVDEAWSAFTNLCDKYERCEECPVFKHREPGRDDKCFAAWLYMDADAEGEGAK